MAVLSIDSMVMGFSTQGMAGRLSNRPFHIGTALRPRWQRFRPMTPFVQLYTHKLLGDVSRTSLHFT
jgi:hypothetical protein